ncbi:hypothetical protein HG537_0C05180 [Torulaspora globosa]|uniref:Ty3 transposon capsid-like protein domain-containing protein n=1 Tax=Torulaspora globosa TaxID=48254 RepID=A0A7H9HRD4_9SACH|nr:hypothetical protein HG537_0C05180 [Torulaspora sp. CBS 2947]
MRTHLFRFEFKSDIDKIAYFGDFLEDEAAQWYDSVAFDYLQHSTFHGFLLAFERKYYNSNQIDSLLERMKCCTQKTTVSAYNTEFAALTAAVSSSILPEVSERTFYISGLKNPIKQTVHNYNPRTLEDAIIIASNSGEWAVRRATTISTSTTAQTEDIQMAIDAISSGPADPRKVKLSNQDRLVLKKLCIYFRCRNGQYMAKECPLMSSA